MKTPSSTQRSTRRVLRRLLGLYLLLPLLWLLAAGDFSRRDSYQELFSFVTLGAFCLLPGQLCWFPGNRVLPKQLQRWLVGEYHVFLGSAAVLLLCIHPFLVVLPKLFDSGLTPSQAFFQMLGTPSASIISGIICWVALLLQGLTGWLRPLLPISPLRWRQLHILLALVALSTGLWHTLLLGRHLSPVIICFFCPAAGGGIAMLGRTIFLTMRPEPKELPAPASPETPEEESPPDPTGEDDE